MTTLKLEQQQSDGGGGGGDVTKAYVDARDAQVLVEAKAYADLNPEEFTTPEWEALWG